MGLKRLGDRPVSIELVLEEDIMHIISAYAAQAGSDESVKRHIWEEMHGLIPEIPSGDKVFLGGDLDGHVGKGSNRYEREHGGQEFGERNKLRDYLGNCVNI